MLSDDLIQWLRVIRTPSIGPITFHYLYNQFKNPLNAIDHLYINKKQIPSTNKILTEIHQTYSFGAQILFFKDEYYPALLKHTRDCPPFLMVKGNLELLKMPAVAIVGSRSSSVHGNHIAYNIAKELANCGYVVVSGLARGIDKQAHLGAFPNTIGVIANGLDKVYPPENEELHNKIINEGLVITENPIGTSPVAHLFPARNRIVAGLSLATLVVEATRNSGSLLTAQLASEYNREVMAIPGCPLESRSYGCNKLIQQHIASLIQNHQDILKILHVNHYPIEQEPLEYVNHMDTNTILDLKPKLRELISTVPVSIDEIHRQLDMGTSIAEIRTTLIQMEIDGTISHLRGDKVMLNFGDQI